MFKKQQREIDQKEFELRKQKKKTIIDMKVDAGTIQDLSKRLGVINERIEAVNNELNDAEFQFESSSSDLKENLSAIDKCSKSPDNVSKIKGTSSKLSLTQSILSKNLTIEYNRYINSCKSKRFGRRLIPCSLATSAIFTSIPTFNNI